MSVTIDDAVNWIRANCQVDTGDEIYGKASIYTAAQIKKAIRVWAYAEQVRRGGETQEK